MFSLGERRGVRPELLYAATLGCDALATFCGLHAALLLTLSGPELASFARDARAIAPLLVFIRLVTVVASRLHRWQFRTSGPLDAARLVLAMAAASLIVALACRSLPRPVCALEFFLTTSFMGTFRFAHRFAEGFHQVSHVGGAVATFATSEQPRRALNFVVALLSLVALLPLCILIAIAIKLTSRGPVLYNQDRIGLDLRSTRPLATDPRRRHDLGGRPFVMYKFRTMKVDAEASTGAVWSTKDDPRVTSVGRVLRHCRLDELPQLINVLKGDMNVVGPRPERPTIFAELRTKIPDYAVRQRARPGITGYAQVNLEYDSSVDDVTHKLRYDLSYLSQQSAVTDLYIMLKTIPVMLFRKRVLTQRVGGAGSGSLLGGGGGA